METQYSHQPDGWPGQQETTEGWTDRQIPYLVIRQRESNQDVALSLICPVCPVCLCGPQC